MAMFNVANCLFTSGYTNSYLQKDEGLDSPCGIEHQALIAKSPVLLGRRDG